MSKGLLIKLGGAAVAGAGLGIVANEIAAMAGSGRYVVVVHGGGPQTSQLQKRLGQVPHRVAGRRVTDEAALEAIKMVVGGQINIDVCASLLRAGARPIGLHGASSLVLEATRRPARLYAGQTAPVDLGLVGDLVNVDHRLLTNLAQAGHVPVLACIGASRDGQVFNINADVVASRVALEIKASTLVLISDMPGVLSDVRDPSSRISTINKETFSRYVADGTISDGMIPKLEEAFEAISEGVERIHIVGDLRMGDLMRELQDPGSIGTVLVP